MLIYKQQGEDIYEKTVSFISDSRFVISGL